MSKRIIAVICLFALVLGFVPGVATKVNAAENKYQVGYSKKNINPIIQNKHTGDLGIRAEYLLNGENNVYTDWDDHATTTKVHKSSDTASGATIDGNDNIAEIPIIKVPLRGYGGEATRLATMLTDDNGDGFIVPGEDGLFVTATFVTDTSGNSVVYMTMDVSAADGDMLKEIRSRVYNALKSDLPRLQPDHILLTASHSHSSFTLITLRTAWNNWAKKYYLNPNDNNTPDNLYAAYYEYIVAQSTEAVLEAYSDRSAADMSKGQIDASDAMKEMGHTYKSGDLKGQGFMMNFNRHYELNVKKKSSYLGNEKTYNYYVGDNFGYAEQEAENRLTGSYTKVEAKHVTESDDMLQILRFSRSGKNDVVMIDWRAHASVGGKLELKNVSSDYVNALRYYLEQKGYCVGFWQGAAGNVNAAGNYYVLTDEFHPYDSNVSNAAGWATIPVSDLEEEDFSVGFVTPDSSSEFYCGTGGYYDIMDDTFSGCHTDQRTTRAVVYGTLMGKIAHKCLEDKMSETLDMGEIKVMTFSYRFNNQKFSDDWKTAIDAYLGTTYENVVVDETPYSEDRSDKKSTDIAAVVKVGSKYYPINGKSHSDKLKSHLLDDSNWNNGTTGYTMNVVVMGTNVGLVTGAGELFDYYATTNLDGSLDPEKNAWRELDKYLRELGLDFDRLFAISYTNGDAGYVPNTMAYKYKSISNSKYPNNVEPSGSYEANTSSFAQGTGEKVIEMFKTMLTRVACDNVIKTEQCDYCNKEVVWTPYYKEMVNQDLTSGHYYLAEDLNGQNTNAVKNIGEYYSDGGYLGYQRKHVENVCLDLNGHSFKNIGRCFTVARASRLAILDSVGGGIVSGTASGANQVGGTYHVQGDGGTVVLKGGTHTFEYRDGFSGPTHTGAVFEVRGTLNVYQGAVVKGSTVAAYTKDGNTTPGRGGAIYARSGSKIGVFSGGVITSGSVSGVGEGPCIYAAASYNSDGTVANTAKVTLYSNAQVDDIYYEAVNPSVLSIGNWFSGKLGITLPGEFTEDTKIGTVTTTSYGINMAKITVNAQNVCRIRDDRTYVYADVANNNEIAFVNNATHGGTVYTALDAAVTAAAGATVKLIGDITTDVTLTTDATIDLNGHSITGTLNTASGKKINLMDSATDDFDVADGVYGKVKITDANKDQIAAVTAETSAHGDGYLMIKEGEYTSFHRVHLKINTTTLRPAQAAFYYKSSFAGDQKVAEQINSFGVALSLKGAPSAQNMATDCLYSEFTGFKAGADANGNASSTLLYNILKSDRTDFLNNEYAKMMIYGRPFIKLTGGQYFFGETVARSMRQQVEAVDNAWNQLNYTQTNAFHNMYNTYNKVMAKWDINNVKNNKKFIDKKIENGEPIKILEIGNSHGLDSTNLLIEIIKNENPNAKVIVGALYKDGSTLQQHYEYMSTNSASYSYHKNATFDTNGVAAEENGSRPWTITQNATALYGLQDEDWDIITLQQMNHWSAKDYLYIPSQMNYIVDYIKDNKLNPENEPILMWNMIWANPQGDLMTNRDTYDKNWSGNNYNAKDADGKYYYDMNKQFADIYRCTQTHVMSRGDFVDVLPVGTAIQYALKQYRTNNAENKTAEEIAAGAYQEYLYRDYTHVSDYGRLMIAYVWYAKIFSVDKLDDIKVTTIPENLQYTGIESYPTSRAINDTEKRLLIDAVNWAIKNPYYVG